MYKNIYKNENNGKYYVKFNYRDYTGKIKQKKKEGFRTKKEADDYREAFIDKIKNSSDILFKDLYDKYMDYQSTRLKPTTLAGKEVLFRLKVLPKFGEMPINLIESATVMEWQNELMKMGYSDTYLKTIHNQLSAILNFGMKFYKLEYNAARLCGSMGKKDADSMQFYTVDEFNEFIGAYDNKMSSRVIFTLMFYSGIRSGELLALTRKDINMTKKTMSISKNYARHNGEDLIMEPKTKKGKRKVALSDFVIEMLDEYFKTIPNLGKNDRIFPFTKSHLNTELKRGIKLSGTKKIRVHDLRHSHASHLIELGFPILLIADRLGHEKIETTLNTYGHLYPDKQSEVANKLDVLYAAFEDERTQLVQS